MLQQAIRTWEMFTQALGQYNEAKEYHEKALFLRKRIFGGVHVLVAISCNNLAGVNQ